jgi:hypothetical protein
MLIKHKVDDFLTIIFPELMGWGSNPDHSDYLPHSIPGKKFRGYHILA